jgi:hypothetical protein
MESGFSFTFNFATLKIKVYIFSRCKNVSSMSYKIFMNFVEILMFLQIFELFLKKIHVNYKMYSKTLNFFIVCVNHNEQHNGG